MRATSACVMSGVYPGGTEPGSGGFPSDAKTPRRLEGEEVYDKQRVC
jgi:hypothetical protein